MDRHPEVNTNGMVVNSCLAFIEQTSMLALELWFKGVSNQTS